MTEIRDVPVVSDAYRDRILGKATIKDGAVTIVVQDEVLVAAAESLITMDQIRCFTLGLEYHVPRKEVMDEIKNNLDSPGHGFH